MTGISVNVWACTEQDPTVGFLNKAVKICLHKGSESHEQSYSEFTCFNYYHLNPTKQGQALRH
jgi:hypothetical protein